MICFFNSNKVWGGGEKWHYEHIIALHEKKYPIMLIANKSSELSFKLQKTNIKIFNFKITNFSFLNIFKILEIKNILEKNKVETIILNLPADVKIAGIAAKLAKVKNIIYRRGTALPVKNSLLNRFLFRKIVSKILVNSQATQNKFLEKNPNLAPIHKFKIIYNGLKFSDYENNKNLAPLYKRQNNEIILGNAARLDKQKGQKFLVEIAQKLKKENINFKILIAGSGELEQELKNYAKKLDVSDKIIFLGFVENISIFMQNIDIFLLTSFWEGFGYVLAEAMFFEKPIIAFNVSSNKELVQNNKTGFLIKAFDLEIFTKKIIFLTNNKKLREEFGKLAKSNVFKFFDAKKNILQFIDFILKV